MQAENILLILGIFSHPSDWVLPSDVNCIVNVSNYCVDLKYLLLQGLSYCVAKQKCYIIEKTVPCIYVCALLIYIYTHIYDIYLQTALIQATNVLVSSLYFCLIICSSH